MTDVIGAHIRDLPQPLQNLANDVPSDLRDLVHAMMAKLPAHRPRMQDVQDRLDRMLGTSEQPSKPGPIFWSAATLSLAAALSGLLYFLLR